MVQQYYNLEEAAQVLGISTEELNGMRERAELRAFADRGTWKFRTQDIDDLAQQRGAGSGGLLPVGGELAEDDEQVLLSEQELGPSDSNVPSTVIGMGSEQGSPSDSDVRVVPETGTQPGSDSDVKLVPDEHPSSDSDVKVMEASADSSDSDVRIDEPPLLDEQAEKDQPSDFEPMPGSPPGIEQEPDQGDAGDSSLVLGGVSDSEISIAPSDSGISLGSPSDSGISLEQPPDAAPTEAMSADAEEELLETDFEVPVLKESGAADTEMDFGVDSDFELSSMEDVPEQTGTQVLAVEGDEDVDPAAATTMADAASALLEDIEDSEVEAVEGVEAFEEEEAMPLPDEFAAAPAAVLRAQETEWGKLPFIFLTTATVLMLLVSFMMFDLVRNLWNPTQPNQLNSAIMNLFTGG